MTTKLGRSGVAAAALERPATATSRQSRARPHTAAIVLASGRALLWSVRCMEMWPAVDRHGRNNYPLRSCETLEIAQDAPSFLAASRNVFTVALGALRPSSFSLWRLTQITGTFIFSSGATSLS